MDSSQTLEKNGNGLKTALWVVAILMLLIGLPGVYDRLANGHIGANYGNLVTWGLWVAGYIFYIGLSAGAFLISSLLYVFGMKQFEKIGRLALFTAVVTLFLALLMIWMDLGHMGRAWHVMAYSNWKSPMAWMIWLYTFYFLLLCAELWLLMRSDFVRQSADPGWKGKVCKILKLGASDTSEESEKRDMKLVKILGAVGVPLAIMFHGGVGALFGTVAARPMWHSGLYPILFLLSAIVSGGALLMLVAAIFGKGLSENRSVMPILGKLVLATLLLDVLFQISEFLVVYRGGIPDHVEALNLVVFGEYWWVFWGLQLGIGTVIPIVILASKAINNPKMVALAGLLVVLGFIGVRLNIVIPALSAEEIHGFSEAIANPRMSNVYFPSLTEWLVTIGVCGVGLILFGIGEKIISPVRPTPGTEVPSATSA
ncbi:MAG: polysulfide reductase NrfD [Planctomycetes bacterium]|nr:polysulfide reductase NrfD [Planctomycetota bacterium]